MKRILTIVLAVCMVMGLLGCSEKEQSLQIIAMDTAMTFTAYGKQAEDVLQDASTEVRRLDKLLSRTNESSLVSQLNAAEGNKVAVGQEVAALLAASAAYTAATGGAFDITVAPVVSAWGFTTDSYHVPAQKELEILLERVGMEKISLTEDTAALAPEMGIDLGAIAKGYASDRIAELFREQEVQRGWAALGGNVLAWGSRPDGKPWVIGIQDPANPNDGTAYAGMIQLESAFAVTSGSYQRFFEENGKIYHHIIDPATGYPADSGLVSVTVVAAAEPGNGTMCDALSTALFVMGEERAVEFWRSGSYEFDMILVTEDGRVVISPGLEDSFTVEGGYVCETVS